MGRRKKEKAVSLLPLRATTLFLKMPLQYDDDTIIKNNKPIDFILSLRFSKCTPRIFSPLPLLVGESNKYLLLFLLEKLREITAASA